VRNGRYAIDLEIPDGDTDLFTLTATPVDTGPMAGDGTLTYDEAGTRGWDRNDDGAFSAAELTWQE
jgi:hypothetical protein